METTTIATPTGRQLEVRLVGDLDQPVVVYSHGTPSAAVPFGLLEESAARQGLSVLSWSRPGYGSSSPQLGRHVCDVVADAQVILAELSIERFGALGWSGGGPHALALGAAGMGCRGVVTIGGVAPSDAAGLDFLAGMAQQNVEEFTAAQHDPETFAELLAIGSQVLPLVTQESLVEALRGLLAPSDVAMVDGPLGEHLVASLAAAVQQGTDGWRDDDLAFLKPWGFELDDVAVDVVVVQGTEDQMVPLSHGRYLAAQLPQATWIELRGAGHLSPFSMIDSLLGTLADQLG